MMIQVFLDLLHTQMHGVKYQNTWAFEKPAEKRCRH